MALALEDRSQSIDGRGEGGIGMDTAPIWFMNALARSLKSLYGLQLGNIADIGVRDTAQRLERAMFKIHKRSDGYREKEAPNNMR
jgi:hypothetical protein